MSILGYIISLFLIFTTTIWLFFKWRYGHWKRRNVPYVKPMIPLGNLENPLFMKKSVNEKFDEVYREYKSKGVKVVGMYTLHKPVLMIVDPELIKTVLTKDFSHFVDHGIFIDEENDPLTGNLLSLEGERWKNMRGKLSPTFTSGKIKIMFDAMKTCGMQLIDHLSQLTSERKPLDIREIMSCYTTDVIGSCAFGVDCNSLKDPDAEFRKYGRKITQINFMLALKLFIMFIMPELNKILRIRMFPRDVTEFFSKAIEDVIDERNSTNTKRNDFIQLLLEINEGHGKSSEGLSMKEMTAQAFIFFLGGFETTSTNLSYCFYELALQPDIQQKVREEVFKVMEQHDGQLTYDGIMEMKYMDQVIDESLRKYPSVPLINRQCTKTYAVPGTDITIEKGTSLFISALSLHMDADYFPNPEKFDPERFSKENKSNLRPYTYLPFSEGPRSCIGRRFAIMQMKVGLSLILANFKLVPHETTPPTIKFHLKNVASISPSEVILLYSQPLK